jgi:hypothetical protein
VGAELTIGVDDLELFLDADRQPLLVHPGQVNHPVTSRGQREAKDLEQARGAHH